MNSDSLDTDLLAAVAGGDAGALETLYERHATPMLRYLLRSGGDRGVAEEILQESWLAIWQSAASFRGQSSVRSWAIGVARRQAHNLTRGAKLPTVPLDTDADIAAGGLPVEDSVLAAVGHEQLVTNIGALVPHLREAAMLAWVEEMSYKDISEALGIPVGTVKSRIFHARARLARELSNYEVTA
jgi:RNA polymerase sigma factor (sigma-70 family)